MSGRPNGRLSGRLSVAAVCLVEDEQLLTVRRGGSASFSVPGVRVARSESALQAARREVADGLGLELAPGSLRLLGEYAERAVDDPDAHVAATVYVADVDLPARLDRPAGIAEVRWTGCHAPYPLDLAPLLRRHVLPALVARGA